MIWIDKQGKTHDMNHATIENLQKWYDYCNTMLYNTNVKTPGRYVLIDKIKEQINKCNVELFLRKLETKNKNECIPRFKLSQQINEIKIKNKHLFEGNNPIDLKISDIVSDISSYEEYEDLSVDLVNKGCLDTLGVFKKYFTLSFIVKLGLWLTNDELKNLKVSKKEILNKVKENFRLKDTIELKVSGKGLSLSEFEAMITLKPDCKYSEMNTTQLLTLRNKVLFIFIDEVKKHAKAWENRKKNILSVCKNRGIVINE